MISDVEILYGLANRCQEYGIKKNISSSINIPLTSILEICDGVDGAEKYGWDLQDLQILKDRAEKNTFTKIEIGRIDEKKVLEIIEKHSDENGRSYLKGIYIHDKINAELIDHYKFISSIIKDKLQIKIGFSIYNQEELEFLLENNLSFELLQIPYNSNVRIDFNLLKKLKCDIYIRSIFLQGIYFIDLKDKFDEEIRKKIILQKRILLDDAKSHGLSLGQYLFSKSLSFCIDNSFKGIIFGSSSFERVNSYIQNHIYLENNRNYDYKIFDTISDYLADPRKWKI